MVLILVSEDSLNAHKVFQDIFSRSIETIQPTFLCGSEKRMDP
jgi:hypothetical protein